MLVGSADQLADVLEGSAWGIDLDYGTRWTLDDQPGWALHLRVPDPADDTSLGTLYARRPRAGDGPSGAVLAAGVSHGRLEALLAVLDGTGDLRDLARLVRSTALADS